MAKKEAKVVEMPKAEAQQQANNQPTYEQVIQVANQLSQQNRLLKERVAVLETELGKFANNYQRIVFLQETIKLFNESKTEWKGLFGRTKCVETLDFGEGAIESYVDELVELLKDNKAIPAKAKEILKPKAEEDGSAKQTKE